MSDLMVVVGQIESTRGTKASARRFKAFHDRLMAIPEAQTKRSLSERLSFSSASLLMSLHGDSSHGYDFRSNAREYLALSSAQEQLEILQGQRKKQYRSGIRARPGGNYTI